MAAATGNEQRPAILDDVPVRVAGMMLMNADGGDHAGRQHEPCS